ncbi:hypothetical protein TEQG_04847 [Trichophyton equinum CBS 127.97]|uniref:Uncharacterized protein n=1 Tax=Trichophyton equinum (strain ATCC MYA-4606 / CBS 127.97) TaxID=559882 RepID=F2PVB9_TRIEC|nr:hypothetical protein TEQG_04847 [Trichophyton equinum CBS 127.97]
MAASCNISDLKFRAHLEAHPSSIWGNVRSKSPFGARPNPGLTQPFPFTAGKYTVDRRPYRTIEQRRIRDCQWPNAAGLSAACLAASSFASRGIISRRRKLFLFGVIVGPRARLSLSQERADVVEFSGQNIAIGNPDERNRAEGGSTETRFIFRPPQRKFKPMFVFSRSTSTSSFFSLSSAACIYNSQPATSSQQTWVRDEEIARAKRAVVSRRKARFAGVLALWLPPRKDDYVRKAKARPGGPWRPSNFLSETRIGGPTSGPVYSTKRPITS